MRRCTANKILIKIYWYIKFLLLKRHLCGAKIGWNGPLGGVRYWASYGVNQLYTHFRKSLIFWCCGRITIVIIISKVQLSQGINSTLTNLECQDSFEVNTLVGFKSSTLTVGLDLNESHIQGFFKEWILKTVLRVESTLVEGVVVSRLIRGY